MTRIADLLDRDLSRPIEEVVKIDNDDPDTVFNELSEYIATDCIKAEYECLFSAMAAGPKSANECAGVWVSGFFGSGKSAFAKNLGYVLANRQVRGATASSLFLKQLESQRVTEYLEFLNQAVPYEVFMFDIEVDLPAQTNGEQIAEVMYRVLLRDLDYADDPDISELEIELEKEGKLAAFQDFCREEYREEWRKIRSGSQKFARASALLHRLDPRTYTSTDTWMNAIKARPSGRLSVKNLVERLFDLCEIRRRGKSIAFIVDDMGRYVALGGARLEGLRAAVEQFGKESLARLKAGKIPGPAWIIVTAQEKLQDVCDRLAGSGIDLPELQDRFGLRIDLTPAGIREVALRRVLRKKQSQEFILRDLFRECGAALIQNVKLEGCSRRTEFDEDRFVWHYPYLPHLIDISLDIVASIRQNPDAPKRLGRGNRTLIKQCFEMLVSDRTGLADQPIGILASIDKTYELVEGSLPPEKRKDILDIGQRFDDDPRYPGMASRVAKAICLMEPVKTDLPRTTKNIAALLIQHVAEAPPTAAVAATLHQMKEAKFVRETDEGWKLYDLDELRRAAAALEGLKGAVGAVNPRLPGWRNDLIQLAKKGLARGLAWYMRPQHEFNATVSRSLEELVWAQERLSMDIVALEARLAQSERQLEKRSEKRTNTLAESMQEQFEILHEQVQALVSFQKTANPEVPAEGMEGGWDRRTRENPRFYVDAGLGNCKTAYIIGLFGAGRRYINELMLQNIGERARYFRDTIRLHPGPTPMIYSGHATVKHVSSFLQYPPAVMSRILEAVESGFANLIFVYRHPLDSLLTNWVWWQKYIRDNRMIGGITQVYKNTDDLCAYLEQNFFEFEAFAEGDPEFFAGVQGQRFLSFPEFVEETDLHLQSATLALRLEDFMIDPLKEFSKIVEVLQADLDLSRLCLARPKTKPYGYLAVRDKVPRFRDFIDGLNAETKRRIEKIGYHATN